MGREGIGAFPAGMSAGMDDAIYQRIEKQTLRRIQKERSRINRKQIAAAVICLVAILGIVGREPIQAAFEKLFHYLPGAGIYTNDTENTMYRAEMVIDHFEENGVQVRLKNVYGENQMVKLEVELHGDDLCEGVLEEQMENSPDVFLKERYQTVLFLWRDRTDTCCKEVILDNRRGTGTAVFHGI